LFSRISGEHATYKVDTNIEAFGPDKDKYLHLIKVG